MKAPRSIPQYDGRPIAYSAVPVLLKADEAKFIENSLGDLLKEVENFTAIAVKDPQILSDLGVPPATDPKPTPLGLHIPVARFDFLFDGKNINVLELNTDGTAGFNITEWVAEEAELKESENPNYKISQRLLAALLEQAPKTTDVVLMDFPDIGTSWEQHDLVKRWKTMSNDEKNFQIGNPAMRTWKKNSLIYRRALSWQLRAHPERATPFLDDWKNGDVLVIGGWSSDVGMSKAWPAFVKSKFVPETLLLEEAVRKRLTGEKDGWVLKGALSYSGQSVIRGIDLNEARWSASLDQVLRETESGRPWIAQRRIEIPKVDGRSLEFGLYFLNGKPSGYMGRWGHTQAISETSEEVYRPIRITT